VRWHIEHGNLEAIPQGEGVRRSWLVSIDSLQSFRDTRQRRRNLPGDYHAPATVADTAAESTGNAIRELAVRLVEEASRASEFRVRLELSERAETTLREELAEERHRREEAERERDDLRRELHALREPPGAPEMVEEEPERVAETPSDAVEAQGGVRRPWWRRVFGS
jgi:chromosome segregation ATPase